MHFISIYPVWWIIDCMIYLFTHSYSRFMPWYALFLMIRCSPFADWSISLHLWQSLAICSTSMWYSPISLAWWLEYYNARLQWRTSASSVGFSVVWEQVLLLSHATVLFTYRRLSQFLHGRCDITRESSWWASWTIGSGFWPNSNVSTDI